MSPKKTKKPKLSPSGKVYAPGMSPEELNERMAKAMKEGHESHEALMKLPKKFGPGEHLEEIPFGDRMCDDLPTKKK